MKFRVFLGSIVLLWSAASAADMYVDRSIVIFEAGGQPRQDVKVSNTGDDVMYVQVEVLAVDHPGTEKETRTKVSDPKALKLLATPDKLIIPPGGQKLVRIVNLQASNDAERVYRINVTPIVAPLEEESSQLRIVVAYQILTIVQPDKPESNLVVSRTGQQVTFQNTGNTNVLLSEGKQCRPDDATQCEDLASRRLYAGNTWTLDLPFDAPISYSVRSFDGIKKEVFP
ncbi:MAG: fimbria/pilus periplasmic chaperone [Pseudomonadales bacterium]|nr:fimbria/pilus periplasmic chaperone [Pseudomonadales bacterium]